MPVEIWVGERRLEDLALEERLELGRRISKVHQDAVQAWVNENASLLLQQAKGA